MERFEVKDPGSTIEIPEGNAVLWRYMDLAKLLALVSSRGLLFSALDTLGDRFEGQWSDRTFELIRERDELWISDRGDHVVVEDKRQDQRLEFQREDPTWSVEDTINHWDRTIRAETSRRATFVNCWYQEAEESEAMWKLFAGEKYHKNHCGPVSAFHGEAAGLPCRTSRTTRIMPITEFPQSHSTNGRCVRWWRRNSALRRGKSRAACRGASSTRSIRNG